MTSKQVRALSEQLRKRFGGRVEAEPVNSKGRYRFAVVSPKFVRMPHLRRQDAVWKIVDKTLPKEDTLDISLILAFSPKELATKN